MYISSFFKIHLIFFIIVLSSPYNLSHFHWIFYACIYYNLFVTHSFICVFIISFFSISFRLSLCQEVLPEFLFCLSESFLFFWLLFSFSPVLLIKQYKRCHWNNSSCLSADIFLWWFIYAIFLLQNIICILLSPFLIWISIILWKKIDFYFFKFHIISFNSISSYITFCSFSHHHFPSAYTKNSSDIKDMVSVHDDDIGAISSASNSADNNINAYNNCNGNCLLWMRMTGCWC